MNYAKHYQTLIERARVRVLDGYSERHHIVPKCLGGSNVSANFVRLTPEEHYVAHQLLVKMHPGHNGLVRAAYMMSADRYGIRANNKRFGWMRRKFAEASRQAGLGKIVSEETRRKTSDSLKGREFSAETRAKISAAISGEKNPMFGKKHSEGHRAKIAVAGVGRTHSAESKAKISAARKGKGKMCGEENAFFGRQHSDESKAKMRAARLGKTHSDDTRAKISAASKLQEPASQETREKISVALKGRVITPEWREKISIAMRGNKSAQGARA